MPYKHIELFAGCGGMTLGLEAAGFDLYFANELSPMASETFAYNILNDDFNDLKREPKTIWLNSQYEINDIQRQRENPTEFHKGKHSDTSLIKDIEKKLIVGDINTLNSFLKNTSNKKILKKIQDANIDLVSGGPPCQSFSLAGKREKGNKRNQLPYAFAEFAEMVKPKAVILENVSGILRPFTEDEKKHYAWFEVAKVFCLKGYVPICMHINAKFFGLPQNRPRFIMLALRHDLIEGLEKDEVLNKALNMYERVNTSGKDIQISPEDVFFELNNKKQIKTFEESNYLITPTTIKKEEQKTVSYAIDCLKTLSKDIHSKNLHHDLYHKRLDEIFPPKEEDYQIKNHNCRKHSTKIQHRFKFLKLIEEFENGDKNKLVHAIKTGSIDELRDSLKKEVIKNLQSVSNNTELADFVNNYQSKKHSQRALRKDRPAPAALSIPDDVCHYDKHQNRTLTVREMARIQTFPDWFEFRSKDTTGGKNRRFEVPNYTQVGNAVPPLLARELGNMVMKILKM